MDRRSIIGFVLMAVLAAGYFWYSTNEAKKFQEQKRYEDSLHAATRPQITDTLVATQPTIVQADSIPVTDSGIAPAFRKSEGKTVALSNKLLTVEFNTKGAVPQAILLDTYKTYSKEPLYFAKGEGNKFNIVLPFQGSSIQTQDLMFEEHLTQLQDGGSQLELRADLGHGKAVIYTYTLPANSFMLQASLRLSGMQSDLNGATSLPLDWTTEALPTEKDLKVERNYAQVHYLFADEEHDYFTIKMTPTQQLEKPVKWMSVRTHFFNSTLIADNQFERVSFSGTIDEADSSKIYTLKNQLYIPIQPSNDVVFNYRWMMGPNDYNLLKSYDMDFEEMLQFGFGIFAFVKYIVKWIVIPIFNLLDGNIANYGLIIILLTLIIRVFLSFFSYKSYLSMAKMRVLKPEMDALREKYKDDQQQLGLEQMKLYRTAGVNPLGGCLPMLLQMPFLLAMYYFFPNAIELRQKPFLWAEDLSTYDAIFSWTANIPLVSSFYGNHVSLFTLLMTISSFLLALNSRNNTSAAAGNDMNMAMMKWMPFVMPILFLPWFNSFAAGLTFYYTFSNIVSLAQQYIIQKFLIDEKAILAKIEQKRKEPVKQSKWQQRLEEMQRAQQERLKQQQRNRQS